jgi:hypothetical protein
MFFNQVIWDEILGALAGHLRKADLVAGRPVARP